MPGYRDRVIRLPFPELSEPGDEVWVAITNPRAMTADKLQPSKPVEVVDGKPVNDADAMAGMYEIIAGLVIGWHAYDATVTGVTAEGHPVEQPLLPYPALGEHPPPEDVRKLPMEILNAISEQIRTATNPQ